MVYMVDGATPNRLSFEENLVPTELKPAPIRMSVFFAVRWTR